ncbi:energy transducer TonB [Paracoccus liaowanqingii]|uniref:Energy transducer TonB n=1 Tax=Paracoccus liaowanqingii TaxID=2560053 RepID=A0A4P7HQL9_9RHOB|nr:energy transducer TonB [Paracoccus liaowanqingii]QBX35737.1 energy transducer TonB [Paracoccus liaowanqingii]
MISLRTLETAGFFTIAAALHVSAAAIMLPDRLERGAAAEAPPAALSAGGEEIRSMVEAWEAPPETRTAPEIAAPQPAPEPEPAPQPAAPEPVSRQVAAAPLAPPDPTPAQPNLPPPPEPVAPEPIDPAQLDLPDLQQLTPPVIELASPLALEASSRPDRRPARQPRPEPEPEPEPRRAAAPSPQPAPQTAAQAQPAQRAGEGGRSQNSRAGGGGGGVSAETRASAMAQWTAQIATCIGRQFSRVSGARGGRIVVNISMNRNGRVQGATLVSGTGDARIDGQVVRTAQRLRACPAAPAAVTDQSHTFTTPFTLG